MLEGTVKNVIVDRAFGFVRHNNKEYFFHKTGCITPYETLKPGDRVKFIIDADAPKGPRAKDVERF